MLKRTLKYSWLLYSFIILAVAPATVESGMVPKYIAANMAKVSEERQIVTEYLASKYKKSTQTIGNIVSYVYTHSVKYGLDPLLVLAVIEKESGFESTAQSTYGAVGLMQVVPKYHKDKIEEATGSSVLAAKDSKNALIQPETNIKVGTAVMADFIARTPNMSTALKQYSGSAKNYAERVFAYQKEMKKKINESKSS